MSDICGLTALISDLLEFQHLFCHLNFNHFCRTGVFQQAHAIVQLCALCCHETQYNPEVMPVQCEIIEVAHSEDATGYPYGKVASARCKDCGIPICDVHGETCAACDAVFCGTCLAFHNWSSIRGDLQDYLSASGENLRKCADSCVRTMYPITLWRAAFERAFR
jgi:hypothetical protein